MTTTTGYNIGDIAIGRGSGNTYEVLSEGTGIIRVKVLKIGINGCFSVGYEVRVHTDTLNKKQEYCDDNWV